MMQCSIDVSDCGMASKYILDMYNHGESEVNIRASSRKGDIVPACS